MTSAQFVLEVHLSKCRADRVHRPLSRIFQQSSQLVLLLMLQMENLQLIKLGSKFFPMESNEKSPAMSIMPFDYKYPEDGHAVSSGKRVFLCS